MTSLPLPLPSESSISFSSLSSPPSEDEKKYHILCDRTPTAYKRPANDYARGVVRRFMPSFLKQQALNSARGKGNVFTAMVHEIRTGDPNCPIKRNFYKKNWVEMNEQEIRHRVGHWVRDYLKSIGHESPIKRRKLKKNKKKTKSKTNKNKCSRISIICNKTKASRRDHTMPKAQEQRKHQRQHQQNRSVSPSYRKDPTPEAARLHPLSNSSSSSFLQAFARTVQTTPPSSSLFTKGANKSTNNETCFVSSATAQTNQTFFDKTSSPHDQPEPSIEQEHPAVAPLISPAASMDNSGFLYGPPVTTHPSAYNDSDVKQETDDVTTASFSSHKTDHDQQKQEMKIPAMVMMEQQDCTPLDFPTTSCSIAEAVSSETTPILAFAEEEEYLSADAPPSVSQTPSTCKQPAQVFFHPIPDEEEATTTELPATTIDVGDDELFLRTLDDDSNTGQDLMIGITL